MSNIEPQITPELIAQHGLTPEEYRRIVGILGREPKFTELGLFSVMWSEHCSYKSSRPYLKELPTTGPCVVQGPGENAGVIDIGDGQAAVFKIESHNHPSFIEPYQGAATGVGGIIRDIFTMGARPIALLDSLWFGPLTEPKNRYLFGQVVAGIAGYGNCMGVPTVGGDVHFDPVYSLNPLVNVFCLGIARRDRIFLGKASGYGNPVIYVGSKTGRDGIHGATMASEEFDETSASRRPTVQVGDPFTEKLLLEACLELMKSGHVIGIQDMGAAGLTCSSVEMASRGGAGLVLDLCRVPRREQGMTPYELMLSESQERMLLVVNKGAEDKVAEIFHKWDLDCAIVGQVTSDGYFKVSHDGDTVAKVPVAALTDEAPLYHRPFRKPGYLARISPQDTLPPEPQNYGQILLELLSLPTLANKEWVYGQYDHMVRTNTALLPGADAAVLRIKGTRKALAMTVDGNSRCCYLNPRLGARMAVVEAARNLVCTGARPLAITNCLNFGSPERPEVMWQFKEAVEGMAEACRYFSLPVTGGNVSFYNETEGKSIYPTPVIGITGLLDEADRLVTPWFKRPSDLIFLLGETGPELGGAQYLSALGEEKLRGKLPSLDLETERRLWNCCLEGAGRRLLQSAHDVSDGGLAMTVAECCLVNPGAILGAGITLPENFRPDIELFSESPGRILVSVKKTQRREFEELAEKHNVSSRLMGQVTREFLEIAPLFRLSVAEMERIWREAIPSWMGK